MYKLVIIALLLFLTGCNKELNLKDAEGTKEININPITEESISPQNESYINPEGMTVQDRYLPPKNYTRVDVEEGGFEEFLRTQKLKPHGEKVLYYNGREKTNEGIYDSVFDVDIGDRNLHQCADAIMLLRAEYLYSKGQYDDIEFNFVSGFKAKYKKWREGYRIKVDGSNVSYYAATEPSNSYETFRKYMDMVFAYSGTLSLEKELESVNIDDMQIGDIFIIGGSPGHAVIVVDMAINDEGEKVFLLAQSYMPAQQTQLLINPVDEEINPWYSLKEKEKLVTPQWTFGLDELKRFVD